MGLTVAKLWSSVLDALLPEDCTVCGRELVEGERYLCLHCEADMPRVPVDSLTDNVVHEKLATVRPVHQAASLFYYRKNSPYVNLIHDAKYNGRPQLARHLGRKLGAAFASKGFFADVDALVPVPLNRWKMMRRGFNQSLRIAEGVSAAAGGTPVLDVLSARRHSTPTRKNAAARQANTKGIYSLRRPEKLHGLNHVVVVDDVITTGSTVLACVEAIRVHFPSMTVSVMSVAATDL